MAASKDEEVRPPSQHRMSYGSTSTSTAHRNTVGRIHSHSVSLGTPNAHRVNRRKSSASINGVGMAALAAATKDASGQNKPSGQLDGLGISTDGSSGSLPAPLPEADENSAHTVQSGSALMDGPSLASMVNAAKANSKARARRASEGSRVVKERTKSNASELKCETCGKGYKHGSCLTKHLWEHTPEWALTSKLLISKHQQVQLLEAASVLVAMNQDGSPTLKPADQADSDQSSHSPARSGSSDPMEEAEEGSSRTSTPSNEDHEFGKATAVKRPPRRQDSYSSAYSRSYTSVTSFGPSSGPIDGAFSLYQPGGSGSRPSTAPGLAAAHEQADITAAAEGLLSCSLGTPQTGPVQFASDIPPVPPLPARFAKQYGGSPRLHSQYSTDVEMSDDDRQRGGDDEDDEGVFGRMEQ